MIEYGRRSRWLIGSPTRCAARWLVAGCCCEAGHQVGQRSARCTQYENASPQGIACRPSRLFVVADEFTLMLADHPEYAGCSTMWPRKGRSFASTSYSRPGTLDVEKTSTKVPPIEIGLKIGQPQRFSPDHRRGGRPTTSGDGQEQRRGLFWCPRQCPPR